MRLVKHYAKAGGLVTLMKWPEEERGTSRVGGVYNLYLYCESGFVNEGKSAGVLAAFSIA